MHIVYNVLQNEMHNRMRCVIKAIISGSAAAGAAVGKENSWILFVTNSVRINTYRRYPA